MKLSTLILLLSLLFSPQANAEPKKKDKKTDLASQLVGKWTYVSGVRGGKKVAKERLAGVVTIGKDVFTVPGGPNMVFKMAYKLGKGKPATIDLDIKSGPVNEGKAQGIIAIKKDKLMICYVPAPGKRPKAFKSTKDNGAFYFVLKRAKK